MPLRTRLTWCLIVLAAGVFCAMPFYRGHGLVPDAPQRRPVNSDSAEQQSQSRSGAPMAAAIALRIPSNDPQAEAGPAAAGRSTPLLPEAESKSGSTALSDMPGTREPPRIAAEFPPSRESVPPANQVGPNSSMKWNDSQRTARSVLDGSQVHGSAASTEARDSDGPRMHRLRDGDTLHRIAERYLGNPDRWQEILAANRDTLTSAELLPIGKSIRIPPRHTANATQAPLDPPQTNLVPIP
jgi:nucleoid-associated protein YgaU